MKPILKFQLFALFIFVFVGGFSISNIAAELLRPAPSPLPSRTSIAPTSDQVSSANRASTVAPFRSDLKADYAVALAGQTLKSEDAADLRSNEAAQNAVKSVLKIAPHDSRMWLVLALLQARNKLSDSLIAESLKMSYLTAPSRSELISIRLDAVTLSDALGDTDLRELARGDVRLILTRFPDLRPSLLNDYIRGSAIGKTFLEENARLFDPKFADSLRSAK